MISGLAVIDASVVVEYLVDLKFTNCAQRLFRRLAQPDAEVELWAPDLVYPESLSALRKLVHLKAIPAAAGARAIEQLARLPIVATGTRELMAEAWKLRHAVTAYDACYLCLAGRLAAPFVTADARLVRARARTPGKVIFLGDLQ